MENKSKEEKFWEKIEIKGPDDCWTWKNGKTSKGYGTTWYEGKTWIASRLAWVLTNGCISNDLYILHKCDNPPCCNPNHLYEGTAANNMIDMKNKHRSTAGERHGRAKLTNKDVVEIRNLYVKRKVTLDDSAKKFGIGITQVRRILKYERWGHI